MNIHIKCYIYHCDCFVHKSIDWIIEYILIRQSLFDYQSNTFMYLSNLTIWKIHSLSIFSMWTNNCIACTKRYRYYIFADVQNVIKVLSLNAYFVEQWRIVSINDYKSSTFTGTSCSKCSFDNKCQTLINPFLKPGRLVISFLRPTREKKPLSPRQPLFNKSFYWVFIKIIVEVWIYLEAKERT